MLFLVPLALYGWLIVTLFFFYAKDVRIAILMSVIGGVLFLPVFSYDLPLITYDKMSAISLGILLSLLLTEKSNKYKIKFSIIDLSVLIWCFFGPIITSLTNGLGLYDGIYQSIDHTLKWGVFFWVGRKYYLTDLALDKVVYYILIGTLLYVPLCLIEIRLSPQLSKWIYGFYAHSFLQHIRNGGFRPMVFMQHGLMVSLWMAAGTIISFTYWLDGKIKKILKIPVQYIFVCLFITTLLTKSSGSAVLMFIGLISVFFYTRRGNTWLIRILILIVPLYIIFRMSNVISTNEIVVFVSGMFNPERTQSLWFRLFQEDLYIIKMKGHEFFGWGGWNRSAPVDPRTGRLLIVRDAMWLGIYSQFGLFGLLSVYTFLLAGPWKFTQKKRVVKQPVESFILTLIIVLFCLDSLLNSMVNSVYLLVAGILVTRSQYSKKCNHSAVK